MGHKDIQIQTTPIQSNTEFFGILFLEQKLLRFSDSSLVVFEEAQADMFYMFDPTRVRIITEIFNAKKVISIYEKEFIFAYQVVLNNNSILNIIISQGYEQEIQMIYGMDNKKFLYLLNRLDANINTLPFQATHIVNKKQNPFISTWTTWNINFYPLVVPLPYIGRF